MKKFWPCWTKAGLLLRERSSKMDPKFRYELTSLIQSHGGKVTGSVSGVTDYLLKGELDHVTGKCKKAAEKETAVIGYEDLMSLLRK